MTTVVLKLFAGQVTGRTERQTDIKRQLYAFIFGEHNIQQT